MSAHSESIWHWHQWEVQLGNHRTLGRFRVESYCTAGPLNGAAALGLMHVELSMIPLCAIMVVADHSE